MPRSWVSVLVALLSGGLAQPFALARSVELPLPPHSELLRDCEEAVKRKLNDPDSYQTEMASAKPLPSGVQRGAVMRVTAGFVARDAAGAVNTGMVECSYGSDNRRTNFWMLLAEP